MTFDDDHLLIPTPDGLRRFCCVHVDIAWPPPEVLSYRNHLYHLVRHSQITDSQRMDMMYVARGAEYRRLENVVEHPSVVPKIN